MTNSIERWADLVASHDDLKISPFREDGKTYGTPTWIWSVAVGGELYVRAYYGKRSRWYQAAVSQGAGRIHAFGEAFGVKFEPADIGLKTKIDAAYTEKYGGNPYLPAMISDQASAATVKIILDQ